MKKENKNNELKKLYLYEWIIAIFLLSNVILYPLNEEYTIIPQKFLGYSYWLSIGFFLGFRLYKHEVYKIWKKDRENKRDFFNLN